MSGLQRRKPLKRTPLGVGAKSLARGSTFANHVVGPNRIPYASITAAADELIKPARPRVRFKARTPARTQRCFRCNRQAHTWHHWVAQEHLRTHASRLRLDEDEERRVLRDLLRDPRNLSAMCEQDHLDAEHGNKPFRAEEIPPSAYEFARELGAWAVARLDRIGTRPARRAA